jgi:hypothetical protein
MRAIENLERPRLIERAHRAVFIDEPTISIAHVCCRTIAICGGPSGSIIIELSKPVSCSISYDATAVETDAVHQPSS